MKRNRLAKALILSPLTILPLLVGCYPRMDEIKNAKTPQELDKLEEECCDWYDYDAKEKYKLIDTRREEMKRGYYRNETEQERWHRIEMERMERMEKDRQREYLEEQDRKARENYEKKAREDSKRFTKQQEAKKQRAAEEEAKRKKEAEDKKRREEARAAEEEEKRKAEEGANPKAEREEKERNETDDLDDVNNLLKGLNENGDGKKNDELDKINRNPVPTYFDIPSSPNPGPNPGGSNIDPGYSPDPGYSSYP